MTTTTPTWRLPKPPTGNTAALTCNRCQEQHTYNGACRVYRLIRRRSNREALRRHIAGCWPCRTDGIDITDCPHTN